MAVVFLNMNTASTLAGVVFYVLISYLLMAWAGEADLITAENFFYWLIVTASTVGYGDLSPSTYAGKLAASLWVIPIGLSLFALVLTRAGFYLSALALKGKKGFRMIQTEKHCIIIGWNTARTLRLIDLLLSNTNGHREPIVLCVVADIENPMPGKIEFVRVESFSHAESMKRTNLSNASRIIIDTPLDDVTLTTALFCERMSPNSHKTVYFQDEGVGELLRMHCPNIEVIPSVSVEMLARSSLDPGSSLLHMQLLDSTYGMTQYSVAYESDEALKFGAIFNHFKTNLASTIIGVKHKDKHTINLNPPLELSVRKGDLLYYIAAKRLAKNQCFEL